MSVNFTTLVIVSRQEQPDIVRRQVVITQTITSPDSTSTALVTLDRGGPTSSSAPSWSAGAASSDGLGQTQIGIIVGCCIGALVLGIIIWCCCTKRCGCTRYTAYEEDQDEVVYYTDDIVGVTRPARSWPKFPRSIPPPVVEDYVATAEDPTIPRWTAYEASRRYRPNYYGR